MTSLDFKVWFKKISFLFLEYSSILNQVNLIQITDHIYSYKNKLITLQMFNIRLEETKVYLSVKVFSLNHNKCIYESETFKSLLPRCLFSIYLWKQITSIQMLQESPAIRLF